MVLTCSPSYAAAGRPSHTRNPGEYRKMRTRIATTIKLAKKAFVTENLLLPGKVAGITR